MSESQRQEHKERRSAERFVTRNALLSYKKKGLLGGLLGGGGSERPLPIRNISSKGLCFLCDEKLKTGQKLALVLMLRPGEPKLHVEFEVVWADKGKGIYEFSAGGKFTNYDRDVRQSLAEIEKHVEVRDAGDSETQLLRKPSLPK